MAAGTFDESRANSSPFSLNATMRPFGVTDEWDRIPAGFRKVSVPAARSKYLESPMIATSRSPLATMKSVSPSRYS